MNFALTTFILHLEEFMLPCLTKKLFGIDCPGCGLQRALFLLMEGDFMAAFKMYPAVYPMILLFGFLLVNRFQDFKFANKVIIFFLVLSVGLILINYILKFI